MSMNEPKVLNLVFTSADESRPVTTARVEGVAEELRRRSNVGLEPQINVGETGDITISFGRDSIDVSKTQEINGRIIPTVGTFLRDDTGCYTVPQPEYDIFSDTLTCNITVK